MIKVVVLVEVEPDEAGLDEAHGDVIKAAENVIRGSFDLFDDRIVAYSFILAGSILVVEQPSGRPR